MKPDVSKLHNDVIPMLLSFLQTVVNDPLPNVNHKGTITKLFYALEKFTEGLGIYIYIYIRTAVTLTIKIFPGFFQNKTDYNQ